MDLNFIYKKNTLLIAVTYLLLKIIYMDLKNNILILNTKTDV